ncbi:hypothetical protein QVD17_21172 [Tagetes erecta]|uniref:Uncharacterized protein n=1 Tax=Tagetes erecta TaxID=13708 RepID=A0AAD8KR86_TARER|nr:hypothetical protein QVD17_21172 [Tagetes erecta]
MTYDNNQKNRSPCEKFKKMMRNIIKLSSFPLLETDGRSSNVHSPPHLHHLAIKRPKNQTLRRPQSGLDGGGSPSFIKIQDNDHHDNGRANDYMQRGELHNSVINLKASDYIRRFHERNKHDGDGGGGAATTITTLRPPPPPPRLLQERLLFK